MQAVILALLMGGRTLLAAFFVGSMLLAGNEALADAKKNGVPTKLVPQPKAEVPKAPPPVVAAPPKKPQCVWVRRTVVTESPGQAVYVPGVAANICGCCGPSTLWMPGVFASVPSSETVTTSLEEVCQ